MSNQLPDKWRLVELKDVCSRIKVGLATSVTKYYTETGVPIIRNLNIKKGYLDDSNMLYLQPSFSEKHPSKRVLANDVITVHTGANIGLTCVVPKEYNGSQTFTTLITTPKENELDSNYLSYCINSHRGAGEINRLVVGGGKGNLNTGDFVKYRVLLPPIEEQRKIAVILSTWDEAIRLTEELIAAKQQRKKGLMQRLLTGQVRFPKFVESRESQ